MSTSAQVGVQKGSAVFYALRGILYLVLMVILVLVIFPILYALFGSLKSMPELMAGGPHLLPRQWAFDNYVEAWERANFARYTWNSVFISSLSTVGIVLVTTMSGFVLARYEIPGKKILLGALLATMFVSAGTITIYPIFKVAKALGWTGSLWGIVLVYVFKINTAYIFLYFGYVRGISKEIDQAATIDGCGTFGIYRRIIFPLSTPIIATLALLSFKDSWNDYLLPLVFTMAKEKIRPLTVGVVSLLAQRDVTAAWNVMLAGSAISLVPIIVLYTITNRYFISGITAGALKE
jgi:ABC-type glycerol-3-phosphate transport system permease component